MQKAWFRSLKAKEPGNIDKQTEYIVTNQAKNLKN